MHLKSHPEYGIYDCFTSFHSSLTNLNIKEYFFSPILLIIVKMEEKSIILFIIIIMIIVHQMQTRKTNKQQEFEKRETKSISDRV